MEKYYEFKASSVELATKNGLAELGLSEEEAVVEVVSRGGIFSRATVRIIPKVEEKAEEEVPTEQDEVVEEVAAEEPQEEAVEEKETETVDKKAYDEEREANYQKKKAMRDSGKEYLKQMAALMGANVTVEGKVHEDEVCLYVGGEDARMFIGYKGETLEAVQTIVSCYLNKNEKERTRIVVDADFYRERRKKTLTALAKKLAKQAYAQHREISLEPMNSYERRIIHAALANSDEAETRSEGEGKARHVVVVPKNGTMSYGNASSDFRKKGPQRTKSFGYNKRKF